MHAVICIVGPTATGKTDLAQAIACALDGEVVSADSMQIYRGMDIGTGKIPPEERVVPHFGIDLVDPGEPYSAACFQPYARACFADIERRGHTAVLCGGTGLYICAAIDDYDFPSGDQTNNPIRDHYTELAESKGAQALWEELRRIDPESAELIHPNNVRRVVRAFEMRADGISYARQVDRLAHIPQVIPAILLGLAVDPELLVRRIDRRVDQMIEKGLVEEVSRLLEQGFREGITAPQAIGYKEIVAALDGEISLDEAIEDIKCATRRYAKRQRTWFRKDARIHWLEADDASCDSLVQQALELIEDAATKGDQQG